MHMSSHRDEVCYPFILESSYLCDFEVATDELCALIGSALAAMPADMPDLAADLDQLQPLAFHINGSIRGKLAVTAEDQAWLRSRVAHYRTTVPRAHLFVLPRGPAPVEQLHRARSAAKKAIRCMVRVEQEGHAVPEILAHLCGAMCNLFFWMALCVNARRGFSETPFVSKSYAIKSRFAGDRAGTDAAVEGA